MGSPLTLLLGMDDCVQTGIKDVVTSSVASNVNHPECFDWCFRNLNRQDEISNVYGWCLKMCQYLSVNN